MACSARRWRGSASTRAPRRPEGSPRSAGGLRAGTVGVCRQAARLDGDVRVAWRDGPEAQPHSTAATASAHPSRAVRGAGKTKRMGSRPYPNAAHALRRRLPRQRAPSSVDRRSTAAQRHCLRASSSRAAVDARGTRRGDRARRAGRRCRGRRSPRAKPTPSAASAARASRFCRSRLALMTACALLRQHLVGGGVAGAAGVRPTTRRQLSRARRPAPRPAAARRRTGPAGRTIAASVVVPGLKNNLDRQLLRIAGRCRRSCRRSRPLPSCGRSLQLVA